jgi:integrase
MARLTDTRVAALKPPADGQAEYPDDLVVGLRLRIGSGGRKSWIVRTRAGAKVLNKTLGSYPTLGVGRAREQARKFLEDLATTGTPPVNRTFGQLAEDWLEKVAKPNNRSWQLQKRRLEIHVLPKWGDRKLDTIRRADVRELIEAIEGDVSPNRNLTLIRTLFRYAVSRDWIEASPAEAIAKPKSESPRDRFLEMDEVRRVYVGADLLGYPFGGFIKMLLLTAQRRTEVAEVRWSQIDLAAGTWVIPSDSAKSGRAHLVPLSAAAVRLLQSVPRLGEYVWTNDGKSPISGFAKLKQRLDGFLAASGGELQPWVLHDLRRTVATHMVRLGVTETIVGRVLNHAAQGVTAKVYALHSYAPEKRGALDCWAADIQREIDGRPSQNLAAVGSEDRQ